MLITMSTMILAILIVGPLFSLDITMGSERLQKMEKPFDTFSGLMGHPIEAGIGPFYK